MAQPTYILAPHFHFKPGTGPIALGNIISDPLRPHRALTTVDPATLQKAYPRVETFTDYERSLTRGKHRDISLSVWSEFIQTVSGKVAGGHGRDSQSTYTMDSLETTYFLADPSLEEIQERLRSPRVQAVTKANRIPGFRNPVYMVTGLMVAKGFSTECENAVRRSGELELSGNAPVASVQVGAGASLARSASEREGQKWRAGEDVVFAYQLLKIELRGWKGDRVEYDELKHKAAYLGDDDGETDEEYEELNEVTISRTTVDNLPGGDAAATLDAVELGDGQNLIRIVLPK